MENAKRAAAGKILDGGHVERLDEFRFQVTPANAGGRAPTAKRNRRYDVLVLPDVRSSCTRSDHKNRGGRVLCKHIHAALALARREDAEKEAEANFAEDAVVAAMFRGAAEASRGAEEADGKTGAARSAYAAYRCMPAARKGAIHRLRRQPWDCARNRQGAVQDNPRRRAPSAPGGAPAPARLTVRPTTRPQSAAGAACPTRGAAGSGDLMGEEWDVWAAHRGLQGTTCRPAVKYALGSALQAHEVQTHTHCEHRACDGRRG